MKDILKGSAVIFFFKVIGAASLFGVHLLIARHYGASTLGVFNLVLALLTFSAIFSRLGLDMYVVRILPKIGDNKILTAGFIQKIFKLLFVGSAVSMFLFFTSSPLINQYVFKSFDASSYLFLLAIMIMPYTYFSVMPEVFRGFQNIKIYSFYRNTSQNLFIFFVLAISLNLSNITFDPVWVLYAVLFVVTITMAYQLYKFLKVREVFLLEKGEYREKILIYSYPMLFTSSMLFMMGNVDNFMISYYLDEAQVGIYSACMKLSIIITFILASVNGFVAPKISKAHSNCDTEQVKQIYRGSVKLVVLTSLPIFILLYSFPEFFLGLFGQEFTKATVTLLIINAAFLINALCGPVAYLLNMTDHQLIFMKILMVGLVINLILNLLLIPAYHINGAAIATFCSMSFWNIGGLIILKKKKII